MDTPAHDDLVIAAALACWWADVGKRKAPPERAWAHDIAGRLTLAVEPPFIA